MTRWSGAEFTRQAGLSPQRKPEMKLQHEMYVALTAIIDSFEAEGADSDWFDGALKNAREIVARYEEFNLGMDQEQNPR